MVAFAPSSGQGIAPDVRVQLPSLKFPLGYKIQQGWQASVQQPLCTPLCEVEGTTIMFQVSMLSPYHYFRDNLAWLARALSQLEELGIHKPANKTVRLMLPGLAASKGRINPMLSYLSAFTDSPVWVAPIQSVCARFERLLVGVLRVGGPTKRSTGATLRHPLSRGLGFSHCSPQPLPARPRPRITLLLRKGASHGVAMGRQVLNPDEVLTALSTLGPALNVSFDGEPIAYQLRVMQRTDFLVGVHGAGLSNGMFLDPCGVLVEMWPLGDSPAGAYIDFHGNYAQYHDEYCGAAACNLRVMRNDGLASSRPLMVNTTALLAVMRPRVARWERCSAASGGRAKPELAKPRASYLASWVNGLFG